MARAHKGNHESREGRSARESEAELPAAPRDWASATRLKQASADLSAGGVAIAHSLEATLEGQRSGESQVPSGSSLASLIPASSRPSSFNPLADRLEPEEARDVYRVVGELGAGGMATVYEAVKEGANGFRKRVALKRIHGNLAKDRVTIELLADEARLASLIDHPNVCQVLDFGVDSSGYFLALEFLDGFTLRDVFQTLRKRPEELKEARHQRVVMRIIAGLAEGLHAAHELCDEGGESLHVVHRDVSPHNLFVLRSGSVKVADFGVARARNQSHPTPTGAFRGKMAYSSPEQLRRGGLDRRADIFALGVVTWELLTGERLFHADNESATIVKICSEPAPDVRTRQPNIAPSTAAIVQRALAIEPTKRFETAREMSMSIERALAIQAATVPVTEVSDWLFDLMRAPHEPRRQSVASTPKSAPRVPALPGGTLRHAVPPLPAQRPQSLAQGTAVLERPPATGEVSEVTRPAIDPGAPGSASLLGSRRSMPRLVGFAIGLALLCGGAWLMRRAHGVPDLAPQRGAARPAETQQAPRQLNGERTPSAAPRR